MSQHQFFLFIAFVLFTSCGDDDETLCSDDHIEEITSMVIGDYQEHVHHYKAIDLRDKICLVARDAITYLPYDTTELPTKILDQFNFNGIEINAFDTIVQRSNSFFRFYPSKKEFKFLYSPPFPIDDFRVTPNHGIGYFWSLVFTEPKKFNYFDFSTRQNQTIFQYNEFIPDSIGPVYQYQTYFDNDKVNLFMRTGNNSDFLATTGVLYDIEIEPLKINKRREYTNKLEFNILDYMNFETIFATFENAENLNVSKYDWESDKSIHSYRFANSWLESSYSVDREYLSLVHHSIAEVELLEFINWKSGEKIFSIPLHEDYRTAFVEIKHFQNEYLILYERQGSVALMYDTNGCIIKRLIANNNIEEILLYNEYCIIIRNERNEVEHFEID